MGKLDKEMEDEKSTDESEQEEKTDESEDESDSDEDEDDSEEEKAPKKGKGSAKPVKKSSSQLPPLSKDETPAIGDLVERNQLGLTDKAKRMKAHLAEQELISTMIPLNQGEAVGTFMDFSLNGFSFAIPKGRYVKIPRQVSDMVMESLGMDQATLQNHALNLANRGPEARAALNF
jgi:hypothetical protein